MRSKCKKEDEGCLFPDTKGEIPCVAVYVQATAVLWDISGADSSGHPHMLRHACGYELTEEGWVCGPQAWHLPHRALHGGYAP